MRRWRVTHCRDPLVNPGARWDVWEVDTNDTHAPPTWLGFGSHEQCLAFAVGQAMLRHLTGVRP